MTEPIIRWAILGPGRISRKFAAGLREAAGAVLVAVGSRNQDRADAFAAEFATAAGPLRAHGSYADLAADPDIDAVYIGSPHDGHAAHTLLCLEHGKHVLCEKPLALNAGQAAEMIATARGRNLALMEAVWTRFLPTLVQTRALIAAGAIGELRLIQADFGFRATFDPHSRLFDPERGGGALLDLGIYPLNLAVMLAGEPVEILSTANLGATGVDVEEAIILRHAKGELAVLAAALTIETPREARLLGTAGSLTLCHPWWAGTRLVHRDANGTETVHDLPHRGGGYAHEAEAFMALIRAGETDSSVMPWADSLAVMRMMDGLRGRWGVVYPGEIG